MKEKSNQTTENRNYGEIMKQHSDAELLIVLKKRKLYEAAAAEQAINEAIRRGLIHSESDLVAPEFRDNPENFQWFPKIENERARFKTMKSISRSILVLTVLPVVAGGILLLNENLKEGIVLFVFGTIWGIVAWKLLHSLHEKWIYILGILTALACFWQVFKWVEKPAGVFLDYFVLAALAGFIAYGLIFLYRLIRLQTD